jgi:hypothetical protein
MQTYYNLLKWVSTQPVDLTVDQATENLAVFIEQLQSTETKGTLFGSLVTLYNMATLKGAEEPTPGGTDGD